LKRRAILPALAIAVLPLLPATSATAAPLELTTVSITVSMDLPSSTRPSDGPIVFEVTDVPVGDGPELTGANLVSNPSDWGGSVTVDIDADAGTVTVATEDSNTFETADVTISGPGIGELTLISDDLWAPEAVDGVPANAPSAIQGQAGMPLVIGVDSSGVNSLSWTSTVPGVFWELAPEGAAVFSIAQAAPPSTTTTTTTAAPTTTTTAPAARAAAVTTPPAFTG
jgi:hypothetical protein